MKIDYIREFTVLAEAGNFLEAADRLFISQSSLSKHIKIMETELGVLLFNRTTRKIELSEFGKMFLPYANQIVHIQNDYSTAFLNRLQNTKKTITIGSIPSMVQYNITDILAKFKKDNPSFTVNVIQNESDKLEDLLRRNICDIAFIRQVTDPENEFVKIPYVTDSLAAVFPISHPLAHCETISLDQLKEEDFLLLPKNTRPYNLCMSACEQYGFEPKVAFTDRQIENIIDLVTKGMGITLLMKKLVLHFDSPDISIVDIVPSISTQISLCYKKNIDLSAAKKHFLNYVTSA